MSRSLPKSRLQSAKPALGYKMPFIKEWQERPLQSVYAMVILDAIHTMYGIMESLLKRLPMWQLALI